MNTVMDRNLLDLVTFHLTGRRPDGADGEGEELGLRPALFARYADLATLRYDYPLVLADDDAEGAYVRSLSDLVDAALTEIAPRGRDGERLRQHALSLEARIRTRVAGGGRGSLTRLWEQAAGDLHGAAALAEDMARARAAMTVDGEVLDCDAETPARLLTHVWTAIRTEEAARVGPRLEALALRLAGILKADYLRSDEARTPQALRQSFGSGFEASFDFEAMARILPKATPQEVLPASRRRRIEAAYAVLRSQRFFPRSALAEGDVAQAEPHGFAFGSCAEALAAFRERLVELAALVKAVAIAELETDNRYKEAEHDPVFAQMDANALLQRDLEWSPAYLVSLAEERLDAEEAAALLEILASELPIKVVLRIDDILGEPADGGLQFSLGGTGPRLSRAAMGLNGAFALQAGGAQLYRLRGAIERGLRYRGPALFSIFTGAQSAASRLPPYLVSAAAVEARAFPVFVSDPSAGADWASRFSVAENAQVEADWPVQSFTYEDQEQHKLNDDLAFTFADFVACDRRYASHFATVPRGRWDEGMVPVSTYLELETEGAPESVPYVMMVDADDAVQRVVVNDRVIHAARRCVENWRGLRELGGIDNSHARRSVENERRRWEAEREPEVPARTPVMAQAAPQPPAAVTEEPAPTAAEAPPVRSPDEPRIETPRCTTCDECTEINNRMFAYDDNKQAYIVDADAGTYRQMVEAAESCQVAIIHPGKPRNPDEPGLDELIARAAAFA